MSSKLDYLRRYLGGDAGGDGAGDGEKKKKRKRKKERDGAPSGGGSDGAAPRAKKLGTGITVHDDDVDDWKYAAEREAERRAREEEGPVVVGGDDPGVSKGRARQYLGIREDGSGWAVADGDGDGDANGDDDLSPPRPGRHDSDDEEADLSPPRRRRHDSDDEAAGDLSPPRRGGARSPSPDLSPPRRRARSPSNEDLSPPRKRAPTMTDGTATGLVDAATVVREAEEKRAAAKARMERLGDDASGRFAATAVRDKATGRILTAEEVAAREAAKDAAKKPKERERPIWATGVAQAKQIAEGRAALAEESTNPFARSDIDARADAAMREAERFGDPMAYLARRRERQGGGDIVLPSVVEGISEEALKKSGFRIPQEVPAHSWMRRGIGAAPNRYGIRPGRHWDGVDRSTGFEQELFKTQNQVRARDHSAWKMAQAMWE